MNLNDVNFLTWSGRQWGGDPSERKIITEEVFRIDNMSSWKASEFIAFVQSKINSIPSAFLNKAVVKSDGDEWWCLTCTYKRPETDEEINNRLKNFWKTYKEKESTEKALYERLKHKYGKSDLRDTLEAAVSKLASNGDENS